MQGETMPTATKVFLAIVATLVVVLVVYYSRASDADGAERDLDRAVSNPEVAAVEPSTDRPPPDPALDVARARSTDASTGTRSTTDRGRTGTAMATPPADPLNVADRPSASLWQMPRASANTTPVTGSSSDASRPGERRPNSMPGRSTDRGNPPIPNGPLALDPPTESTAAPTYTEYVVRSGDTMSDIALEALGSATRWVDIAQANPLVDPHRLRVGATLRIPIITGSTPAHRSTSSSSSSSSSSASSSASTYVVRPSDTLSSIAKAMYDDERRWYDIYAANRNVLVDPDTLEVGQSLRIPR